jgi:hypothetical protein
MRQETPDPSGIASPVAGTLPYMGRTRTQQFIDSMAMWSSLAVYFIIWVGFLSAGFAERLLIPALAISAVYVGMHIYEITKRGHCYLSADSTAAPLTIALCVLGCVAARVTKDAPWLEIGAFLMRVSIAFIVAHIAALVYSATLVALACWCARSRIASERINSDQ